MSQQLERIGLTAGKSATDFANDFAAATAHRSAYALAIVHGATVNGSARPYAMTVTGRTSHGAIAVPSEAPKPWTRGLPFAELTQFHIPNEYGVLVMIYPAATDDPERGAVRKADRALARGGCCVSLG
jgi:hypothetical protein